MMGIMSAISFGQSGFEAVLEERKNQGDDPIKGRGDNQRFQIVELSASNPSCAPHNFVYESCCGYQCRIFCHRDEVVAHWGNGKAQRLWKNDTLHCLLWSHTESHGG